MLKKITNSPGEAYGIVYNSGVRRRRRTLNRVDVLAGARVFGTSEMAISEKVRRVTVVLAAGTDVVNDGLLFVVTRKSIIIIICRRLCGGKCDNSRKKTALNATSRGQGRNRKNDRRTHDCLDGYGVVDREGGRGETKRHKSDRTKFTIIRIGYTTILILLHNNIDILLQYFIL